MTIHFTHAWLIKQEPGLICQDHHFLHHFIFFNWSSWCSVQWFNNCQLGKLRTGSKASDGITRVRMWTCVSCSFANKSGLQLRVARKRNEGSAGFHRRQFRKCHLWKHQSFRPHSVLSADVNSKFELIFLTISLSTNFAQCCSLTLTRKKKTVANWTLTPVDFLSTLLLMIQIVCACCAGTIMVKQCWTSSFFKFVQEIGHKTVPLYLAGWVGRNFSLSQSTEGIPWSELIYYADPESVWYSFSRRIVFVYVPLILSEASGFAKLKE